MSCNIWRLFFFFGSTEHENVRMKASRSHLRPLWAGSLPAGPQWTWAQRSCPARFHPAAGRSRCGGRCPHGPSTPDGSPVPFPEEIPGVDDGEKILCRGTEILVVCNIVSRPSTGSISYDTGLNIRFISDIKNTAQWVLMFWARILLWKVNSGKRFSCDNRLENVRNIHLSCFTLTVRLN